jgi:Heavy-metal-associated domain
MMKEAPPRARAVIQIRTLPKRLDKLLKSSSGVLSYEINYVNNTLRVEFDPEKTSIEELRKLASV